MRHLSANSDLISVVVGVESMVVLGAVLDCWCWCCLKVDDELSALAAEELAFFIGLSWAKLWWGQHWWYHRCVQDA